MQNNSLIEFSDLSLSYGDALVLKNVSFKVDVGDYVFFLGKNGSGKSTLVKSIFSKTNHKRGAVKKCPSLMDNSYISYVPQLTRINNELPITVEEFVDLGRLNSKSTYTVQDVLEMVSMSDYKDSSIWALSGGQRQRVLLARSFIRDAKLYIFDEPTNGVDIESKQDFYNLINEFSKEKMISKIVVTHDVSMAVKYGQKVAYFNNKSVQVSDVDVKIKSRFSEMIHLQDQFFKGLNND
ncbi:MAG: ATP-binding cassette domain-containing protein [Candidatus Cloacimonetes bacterium]|nr:ATP-binding cassette domain-containing protein [Candidatus Cloacimonadota bacterium]